jgi:adenylate cyclase class 2
LLSVSSLKLEIEAKVKVDLLEPIAQRLDQVGASFKHELLEKDSYFIDSDRMVVRPGCGLRLRREKVNGNERAVLTYKGPKKKTKFKTRQEIEVDVNNAAMAEQLLVALGCYKKLTFEKKRSLWQLQQCLICLDELPLLGCFVEVEGPDEAAISDVLKKIGLSDREHINKGYAKLMKTRLDEIGSKKTEISFGNYVG